ncbi:hypothetical protein VVT58_17105 (plasmid) [Sphingobium sp. SJ10-10]|uniref:hypothetical protein n=1 Tax=Sphingobium sp. SJ10-10 TaxID=3114999 RepID=UPI002E19BD90|nr:hypothetical protein [Sphingobium sp. SJ10-10]
MIISRRQRPLRSQHPKSIGKRGVDHLRVADCPATPGLPSGNMNAPAMALGWLAADIIGADDG